MQEYKMEVAENSTSEGLDRAVKKYKSLPKSADLDSKISLLVKFQQCVELTESSSIFDELNALSGQTSQTASVDQKFVNVRLSCNTCIEHLPSIYETLRIWNDVQQWRIHMHAVVFNVLENLKEAASIRAYSGQATGNAPKVGINQGGPTNMAPNQTQAVVSIFQSLQ